MQVPKKQPHRARSSLLTFAYLLILCSVNISMGIPAACLVNKAADACLEKKLSDALKELVADMYGSTNQANQEYGNLANQLDTKDPYIKHLLELLVRETLQSKREDDWSPPSVHSAAKGEERRGRQLSTASQISQSSSNSWIAPTVAEAQLVGARWGNSDSIWDNSMLRQYSDVQELHGHSVRGRTGS